MANPISATASQAQQSAQVDAQRQEQNQQTAKAIQADGVAGNSGAAANQKTSNTTQDVTKGTRATGPAQAQIQEPARKTESSTSYPSIEVRA